MRRLEWRVVFVHVRRWEGQGSMQSSGGGGLTQSRGVGRMLGGRVVHRMMVTRAAQRRHCSWNKKSARRGRAESNALAGLHYTHGMVASTLRGLDA